VDILAHTNILIRRINRNDFQHKDACDAVRTAERQGHRICIVPQNIVECWSVLTRPAERNGLGLAPADARRITTGLEEALRLVHETAAVYTEWKRLVALHGVSGLRVFDTRLVASAIANGLGAILTFNVGDFKSYSEIKVLHPRDLIGTGTAQED
jgi:predicted nucleic acid-binding protein